MLVDGGLPGDLTKAGAAAAEAEAAGYDGVWSAETSHDPFLPCSSGPSTPNTCSSGQALPWPSLATR
ncbi:MAG: hypothetical protein WKF43_11155 [Acidimicrobiales bacterium]